jgi:release factor glutamine methyltransferase
MNFLRKKILYKNKVFVIYEEVYEPDEDTFLIAQNLALTDGEVLDMGTGCGILATIAAEKAEHVVAIDVNPYAVDCAQKNVKLNGLVKFVDVLQGNLFDPLRSGIRFDLILFNAPYLPTGRDEDESWIDKAWAGGETGRKIIDAFIHEATEYLAEDGRIQLVQSTLSNLDKTLISLRRIGLTVKVIAEKESMFEKIMLIEASFSDSL